MGNSSPEPSSAEASATPRRAAFMFSPWLELRASIAAGVLLGGAYVLEATRLAPFGHALAWVSLAIGMLYGGRAAYHALRDKKFDIDVLMVLAAGLAAAMGHADDGALLLFLFVLSGALEDRAMQRAKRAVEALHKLMPTAALVWRDAEAGANRPGAWAEADPGALRPDDRIRIRTGELVPADARITEGLSSIDQSTLTGESVPREVAPGAEVYAGTLNIGNPVEALVLRPASESSLQKVLNLVISAQQQREPLQRIIDRFSEPYAIGIVLLSLAVLTVWWAVLGVPLIDGPGRGALHTAIALLIVGSPCALVIATPTATLAAISRGARSGMLFKGGQSIERLAKMAAVCLDKTGTLTRGRPRLHQVHPIEWSDGDELLSVAASLESGSTHPIAVAVVEGAAARGAGQLPTRDLEDLPGRGLRGVIDNPETRLGTYAHCEEIVPTCLRARIREVSERVRERGQLAVVVGIAGDEPDGGISPARPVAAPGDRGSSRDGSTSTLVLPRTAQAGVLILSDAIRPGARELVERLHNLGVRPVRMLTGDNPVTAALVAKQLGIDQFDAELLPQDKVRAVQELKAELASHHPRSGGSGVGVIGDGVNDAPALAAADVSIAIGSIGSDAALESADIVLLSEDLTVIPWAVRLARRARSIIKFNLALALSIITGMAVAVVAGSLTHRDIPLPIAVIAHEGGTLLVVVNSLRLLLMRSAEEVTAVPDVT